MSKTSVLEVGGQPYAYYPIPKSRLPFSLKILLENAFRHSDKIPEAAGGAKALLAWDPKNPPKGEIPFMPSRVLLQDFTGVPCVADLAAMREAVKKAGGDVRHINPMIAADLVIDHSVQVDFFGAPLSFERNVEKEYERNRERYAFLRWAQNAFDNFRVVPPGMGICHQVNLECLATVVSAKTENGITTAFPDTLVGTDSHTTMVNGLGVLGWGVGGIEAEACMLNQPLGVPVPEVVGVNLSGELREGTTATDLVLTLTQMLRKVGVVGKFVEYFGAGLNSLSMPDRATVSNMSPEYGATCGYFPVDEETLRYLRQTGRSEGQILLVEKYMKAQGLFRIEGEEDPNYTKVLELDLAKIEPCLAGPGRPQDRVPLRDMKKAFAAIAGVKPDAPAIEIQADGKKEILSNGSVVISAITSCTNTSNPAVMMAAGLLAKKAVERGLRVGPLVKTSLAPGSRVVMDYLDKAGLTPYLEKLGFHLVGFGCTTCIGNSGPLPEPVAKAVKDHQLSVAAVLSGNRNFEGRINPLTRLAYLASPPLVVAFALAGKVNLNLEEEPLGNGTDGKPVYLRDVWPTREEIASAVSRGLTPEFFKKRYAQAFKGEESWEKLSVPRGEIYAWEINSTYIAEPPFVKNFAAPSEGSDIAAARVLALLGDSVTTDHISPAGTIPADSPAGKYLIDKGVKPLEFNSYGARRGNHEVMVRGTFANIRLKNQLAGGKEGGWTVYHSTGDIMTIYDAAMAYQKDRVPLLVIAGKEYGAGSSRDWAAKGTKLLGVAAVIAESYERIHRSNLVGMGVLPLQFIPGENAGKLGLTGCETFSISGISGELSPGKELMVRAESPDKPAVKFRASCRLDSAAEVGCFQSGGILPAVLRQMIPALK